MSESPPIAAPTLTNRQTMGWWVVGMTAFHAAYFWESAGILIVLYLAAMFYLPHISSTRSAFYVGFLTGYAVCVPHLFFLLDVFGAAAIGLWGVFAIWFAALSFTGANDPHPLAGVWPMVIALFVDGLGVFPQRTLRLAVFLVDPRFCHLASVVVEFGILRRLRV